MTDISYSKRIKRLRAALREEYGTRKYRIHGTYPTDWVEVYGPFPNAAHIEGWRNMGTIYDCEMWLGLTEAPDFGGAA